MIKPQKFQGIVRERKELTPDVILLSFKVDESFHFEAGQFVTMKIKANSEHRLKSYSILSPPSQKGTLDFCIKIINAGFASEVFKTTKEGDSFEMMGPLGHFTFDEKGTDHWFIGTGTGITPLYSMIKEFLPRYPEKKFTLLFGVRTQTDLLFHEELEQLQEKYSHFTYIPTLSREEWSGKTGRVQKHLPAVVQNKTFYICGLKDLVLETKELLLNKGVAAECIRFERYN